MDSEEILNLLGNEYRRKMIKLLSYRRLYPQQIAEILGITPSAVIKNLKILEEAGLVNKEEVDRESGGRPLQFFSIQRNFSFSFDMFHPRLIKIFSWVPEETDHLKTPIKNPKTQIREYFQSILKIQDELFDIEQSRLEKLRTREHLYELLRDLTASKYTPNVINIFRVMLESHGRKWFTRQEIESEHGVKTEETTEILKAWEDLGLIEVDTTDWTNPRIQFIVGI